MDPSRALEEILAGSFLIGRWEPQPDGWWAAVDETGAAWGLTETDTGAKIVRGAEGSVEVHAPEGRPVWEWMGEKFGVYRRQVEGADATTESDVRRRMLALGWKSADSSDGVTEYTREWEGADLSIEVADEAEGGLTRVIEINWPGAGIKNMPPMPTPYTVDRQLNLSRNKLRSLQNMPRRVGRSVNVSHNRLVSVVSNIREVGGSLNIGYNPVQSLVGMPATVDVSINATRCQLNSLFGLGSFGKSIVLTGNKLKTLRHLPKEVAGSVVAGSNPLESLAGSPRKVGDSFAVPNCGLSSLEGRPDWIGDFFDFSSNELRSISNLPDYMGRGFDSSKNPLELRRLGSGATA